MEGFRLSRLAPAVLEHLDAKQFARPGKSTEQAIPYIIHLVLENLDRGNCSAVYCSLIRSILEYGSIVFANLPEYLSNALENIQKNALGIIVPSMSYSRALHLTGLPSLQERRESA